MDKKVITYHNQDSSIAEKYRILRTNIKTFFIKKDKDLDLQKSNLSSDGTKIIVLSSSSLGEGKTLTAVNLAVSMSKDIDSKVLLIDADMRSGQSGLNSLLEKDNDKPGLSDVIRKNSTLEDSIVKTKEENLYYISKGTGQNNPSELIGSKNMVEILDELRTKEFNFIIIDAPSILSYADSSILGTLSDGVVFVVKASETQYLQIKKSISLFKHAHAEIIGLVLNNAEPFS